MPVTVVLPGALRQYSGGEHELKVSFDGGGDLGGLLDAVASGNPALARRIRDESGELRRYVNVYVDGEDVRASGGMQAAVGESAEVLVLPSIAGG